MAERNFANVMIYEEALNLKSISYRWTNSLQESNITFVKFFADGCSTD